MTSDLLKNQRFSKALLTFLAFFIITIVLKIREYKFLRKYDFNYELLEEHISTNAHSFRTSITIAIVFAVIGTIDLLVFSIYGIIQALKVPVRTFVC